MCVVGVCVCVSICTHSKLTNITRLFTIMIWEPRKPDLCTQMTNFNQSTIVAIMFLLL